jgi:dihydropyrimidinase
MPTLIKGGTVVTSSDNYKADVFIEGSTISQIGAKLDMPADHVIDATGKMLFPGGIDVHVHNDANFYGGTAPSEEFKTGDDWRTGTIAAACGGTTTVVDFAIQKRGSTLAAALQEWKDKAAGKVASDYGIHMAITEVTPEILDEMAQMVREGVTSFKLYLAYKSLLMVDDRSMYLIMKRAADLGAAVSVHCENGDVVDEMAKQFLAEGKTGLRYFHLSRPPEMEGEATARAIKIAEVAGVPLYVVHLTAAQALEEVRAARSKGQLVFSETAPHYLHFTCEDLEKPDFEGAKLVCSPPLREKWHQDVLWSGMRSGDIQVIASDHCDYNFKGQKDIGKDNFQMIPNGVPGIETRLTMFYALAVPTGRISLNKFVDMSSTAPAKLFGMFPKKGTIAVGSDADIVIWDPERKYTITQSNLHQNVDYTICEGFQTEGAPSMVFLRGNMIVKDNEYMGQPGSGQYIKRNTFSPDGLI